MSLPLVRATKAISGSIGSKEYAVITLEMAFDSAQFTFVMMAFLESSKLRL